MTRNEYMSRLETALNDFSKETQKEVLEDYESHFAIGLENGKSEDEICRELGSVDLFIEELSRMEPKADRHYQPGVCHSPDTDQPQSSDHISEPSEYHISGCRRLILDGQAAEVFIRPSDDGIFHIFYENNSTARQKLRYHFYLRQDKDTIYTGIRKDKTLSGFLGTIFSGSMKLTLLIPSSISEIQAETVSGDIVLDTASSASGFQVSYSAVSGFFQAHRPCTSQQRSRHSGSIIIDGECCGPLTVSTTSGNAEIR